MIQPYPGSASATVVLSYRIIHDMRIDTVRCRLRQFDLLRIKKCTKCTYSTVLYGPPIYSTLLGDSFEAQDVVVFYRYSVLRLRRVYFG